MELQKEIDYRQKESLPIDWENDARDLNQLVAELSDLKRGTKDRKKKVQEKAHDDPFITPPLTQQKTEVN